MSPTTQSVTTVAVVLSTFATFAVVARLYTRLLKKVGIKSDDWTMVVAMVYPGHVKEVE